MRCYCCQLVAIVFAIAGLTSTCVRAEETRIVDLSLLVSPDFPCTWPSKFPYFQIQPYRQLGPLSAYNSEILILDPNTGTQMDVPPHSIPTPDSGLPNAGPAGEIFPDKVPAWQFCGEACVIDCTDLLDQARNGESALVTKDRIEKWEREHRPLRAGDVVLLKSGYTDKYYRPLPEGRRFIADVVDGLAPAWPDPDVDCMEYLASRGVMLVGTDSASMGPFPPALAEPTHVAGLRHGMIFTESATDLDLLPATGAFYAMLAPKHVGAAGSEARAVGVVGDRLAAKLITSAREKRVLDLSMALAPDLPLVWPGRGTGDHYQPFLKMPFEMSTTVGRPFQVYMLDSHTGTHLIPPAYTLPEPGRPALPYSPEVRGWLDEYERRFGPRGTSEVTTDRVPLSQTCGRARVIDVRKLIGTTSEPAWPASPEITAETIRAYEAEHGALAAGDVVVFRTDWSDKYCVPGVAGAECMVSPLNGKSEGWPAPGPEAINYLAKQGVRCVGTDAPTIGGVDAKLALWTYWTLGSRDMVAVEYLTQVGKLPEKAYFMFAPIKIDHCHGGHGRAIALY